MLGHHLGYSIDPPRRSSMRACCGDGAIRGSMGTTYIDLGQGVARTAAAAAVCLLVANCASSDKFAKRVDPKYGVSSSPRVVDFNEAVPKGGGSIVGSLSVTHNPYCRAQAECCAQRSGRNYRYSRQGAPCFNGLCPRRARRQRESSFRSWALLTPRASSSDRS